MWRGGLDVAYLFAGPFVCRCLTSPTMLRFHTPLIEPDRRISRIRLSEKAHECRPRKAGGRAVKAGPDQTPRAGRRPDNSLGSRARHFVLGAQPLAQPPARARSTAR